MLFGRAAHLERLGSLIAASRSREPGRLLMVGLPGTGRTALLDWAEARAEESGARVVRWDHPVPAPLREPVPDERVDLLLIDDAHLWEPSDLAAAAQSRTRDATSVVVTSLPDPQVAGTLAGWPTLRVEALDLADAVDMLAATAGDSIPAPVRTRVAVWCRCLPATLVAAPGMLDHRAARGREPLPAPAPPVGIVHEWLGILGSLSPAARDLVLDVVITAQEPALARAVVDLRADGEALVRECLRWDVLHLRADGTPVAASPTLGDVVLACTTSDQRRQSHSRAARAAEAGCLPLPVRVEHRAASGTPGDRASAADLESMALQAEEHGQFVAAAQAWAASAILSPPGPSRTRRALQCARMSLDLGTRVPDEVAALLPDAEPDGPARTWVAHQVTVRTGRTDPDARLPALRREVGHAPDGPEAASLLVQLAQAAWLAGDPDQGLAAAQAFQDVAARAEGWPATPAGTASALMAVGRFQLGEAAHASAHRREALRAADRTDAGTVPARQLFAVVLLDDLVLDTRPAATERALVLADRARGDVGVTHCVEALQAWRAYLRGDWSRARVLLSASLQGAGVMGHTEAWLGMIALRALLVSATLGWSAATDDADAAQHESRLRGNRRWPVHLDRAAGLAALAAGRVESALPPLVAAADVPFHGRWLHDAVLPARVDVVEALVRTGQPAQARARAEALQPLLRTIDDPQAGALADRCSGLLADGPAAVEFLAGAVEQHRVAGDSFEVARGCLLHGQALRRVRRPREARLALAEAAETFAALGAERWRTRATDQLHACGGTVDRGHGAELTAQERAVARAAATGMSTREVAEALSMSPRTVEYHLGNAYRKLGVHRRGALGRALEAAVAER